MAVTVDQASIGTAAVSTSGLTTGTMTTTATVASGAMIVVLVHNFNAGAETLTMSGGSLTWAEAHTSTSGSLRLSLFAAFAPAGLASSTVLTVTATINTNDMTMCGASYLGVDTSGTVAAAITAVNAASANATGWASGTVAGNSGDALIGGAGGDGTLSTSTPTGPAVERGDFNSATTSGSVTLVDKLSVAGSDSLAGTWNNTLNHVGIGVAFKAAAAAATAGPAPRSFNAIPFIGGGL